MYYFCNKKREIRLKQNKIEIIKLAYLIKQMKVTQILSQVSII